MLSRKNPYWYCSFHELWEEGLEALQEAREEAEFREDWEVMRCLDNEISKFISHYSGN